VEDQPVAEVFTWDTYLQDLLPLCAVKAEEFHLLGYEEVTALEVLECVQGMMKGQPALHQVVAAIFSLSVGQFMNYMTMNAYKGKLGESFV
jgi:Post-transcriptional regulator